MFSFLAGLELYLYVGLSYKYDEADHYYFNGEKGEITRNYDNTPIAAQLEMGWESDAGVKFGLRHDSTPSGGCPNDCGGQEYWRNEVFIGYKFGGVK